MAYPHEADIRELEDEMLAEAAHAAAPHLTVAAGAIYVALMGAIVAEATRRRTAKK